MSQHLTDMEIDRLSLVDKGANGRVFAILKRQEAAMTNPVAKSDPETNPGESGILRKIKDLLIGGPVAKAQTFAAIIAGQELTDALDDSYWTLWDSLWSVMYAVDDNGQDLPLDAKKALVAQDLDEFKAYLMAKMDTAIGKSARPSDVALAKRQIDGAIARVTKKIKAADLEQLQAAAAALNAVLADAEAGTEKRADAQEADMTPEELTAAIAKALEPVTDRIVALEKAAKPPEQLALPDPIQKADGEDPEPTLTDVIKAIGTLADRVEKIEKAKGSKTSADGQEGESPVAKRGTFAGIL